jgi:hypothetical protein
MYFLLGALFDYQKTPNFSDGNHKDIKVIEVIFQPKLNSGIFLSELFSVFCFE